MTLDTFAVLVTGGILWELINAYIHFVITPWWKKRKAKKNECTNGGQPQTSGNYSGTSMGFNAQLKS